MRQLRLNKEDMKFHFLASSDRSVEMQKAVRTYLEDNLLHMQKYTYGINPAKVEIVHRSFLIGKVNCEKEEVLPLPETGNVYILTFEEGFLLATEYEN